ncbi:MAG: DNA-directed RNA polymerase subunit omega [Microscillaceae bacterium]|nr:DNA-directed RNA polymerase subunit omega [Microscillaceae bacterium]
MKTNPSLITRNIAELVERADNIYEAVAIISRRACQISVNTKEELNAKLADFASTVDNLEEIHENREQIEISKYYERMPKPTTLATDEFLEDMVIFRRKRDMQEEE